MKINLPQPVMPDIFSYGFDRNLYRPTEVKNSPLVYNVIEDRVSKFIQPGESITTAVPNLLETEL